MSRYLKIKVGDTAKLTHTITQSDIEKFVELSGDDNRLHVDEEFANRTSLKKPVAHGMLGASFISTIIGTKIPGDGALWYSQNLEFLLPIRVGDKLTIVAKVIKKIDRQNSIELQTDIINQNKQKVTTGVAKVKVIEDEIKENYDEKVNVRTVLIIGATGGIGSQTARTLAKEGYNLILHYHSNKILADKLQQELKLLTDKKIITVQADILRDNDVVVMVSYLSRYFKNISGFVNASTLNFGNIKFQDIDWDDLSSLLDINIKSNLNLVKNLMPLMCKNSYGKIIFMTSQYTEQIPAKLLHYTTAKSALNGFAKALAVELAAEGVRVNLVSAGMTKTNLISNIPEKVKLVTAANTPLRRLAEPQDVADAISYLVSENSDFLTGETIRVNGGQLMI
jgi:3-oxoacyl-[acyl-carrier protein] reductase